MWNQSETRTTLKSKNYMRIEGPKWKLKLQAVVAKCIRKYTRSHFYTYSCLMLWIPWKMLKYKRFECRFKYMWSEASQLWAYKFRFYYTLEVHILGYILLAADTIWPKTLSIRPKKKVFEWKSNAELVIRVGTRFKRNHNQECIIQIPLTITANCARRRHSTMLDEHTRERSVSSNGSKMWDRLSVKRSLDWIPRQMVLLNLRGRLLNLLTIIHFPLLISFGCRKNKKKKTKCTT